MSSAAFARLIELQTRPIHPETEAALQKRWAEIPEHAKTPEQLLGKCALGREGTHGLFPKCNLTCSPCYHSADANKVRIDGEHTVTEVTKQMALLRQIRGPRAHAQLIGGEVSLLPPKAHRDTLKAMRAVGREPMSMTHGDFDYGYLLDVVLDDDGKPAFEKVSFAAHFDSLMRGRRGAVRPRSEAELNPFREKFAEMFIDLKKQTGVKSRSGRCIASAARRRSSSSTPGRASACSTSAAARGSTMPCSTRRSGPTGSFSASTAARRCSMSPAGGPSAGAFARCACWSPTRPRSTSTPRARLSAAPRMSSSRPTRSRS